jgi:hypothetical protein
VDNREDITVRHMPFPLCVLVVTGAAWTSDHPDSVHSPCSVHSLVLFWETIV